MNRGVIPAPVAGRKRTRQLSTEESILSSYDQGKCEDEGSTAKSAVNPSQSQFLASMTFGRISCDCSDDECKERPSTLSTDVPNAIMEAIRQYRDSHTRQQRSRQSAERRLLFRSSSQPLFVYQWTLPFDVSEPLVEYGSSHRLVWIKSLPRGLLLQAIGTMRITKDTGSTTTDDGPMILGSALEEEHRTMLPDWRENDVIFVPSTGGKAVGWIVNQDDNVSVNESKGNDARAVLCIAKLSADCSLDADDEDDSLTSTVRAALRTLTTKNEFGGPCCVHLSPVDAAQIRQALAAVVSNP
jgi:hypothetical protein